MNEKTILGEPITVKELLEIIENIQSGKSTLEEEAARNLFKQMEEE